MGFFYPDAQLPLALPPLSEHLVVVRQVPLRFPMELGLNKKKLLQRYWMCN